VSIPSRHPEVAEPQPNRSMQDLECYPAFGSSGSINAVPQGQKSSLSREDLGGCLSFNANKIETHPRPLPINGGEKCAAFTLAEVLITLAIIGVVATMTIPTLVQGYKKKVVETRLLSAYSRINQAIRLSEIDNGPISTWKSFGHSTSSTATYDDAKSWFDLYLAPYLKYQKVEKYKDNEDVVVYFIDGSAMRLRYYVYDAYVYPEAKNVSNGLNGRSAFMFQFGLKFDSNLDPSNINFKYFPKRGFEPYTFAWDGTLDGAKYSTVESFYGCYEEYAALCTKLIQVNGWKIPEDYPYKL